MTRHEIRMLAEEIVKLMSREMDEYLSTQEAAAFLKVSVSHLSHNWKKYPSRVVNGKRLYSKRGLIEYIHNN